MDARAGFLIVAAFFNAAPARDEFRSLRVGIVVFEGVELLDFAGPAEVFASAGGELRVDGRPLFEVVTVGPSKAPVLAHGGVTILPCYAIADRPRLDVVLVPGGEVGNLERDRAFIDWLRASAADAKIVMSVCNGAWLLSELGILEAPHTKLLAGRRVVDDGKRVTTGGVSCGIDGALHLAARFGGRRLADQVARYMQYRWQPEPHLEGTYSEWATIGGDRAVLGQQLRVHRRAQDWPAVERVARELTDLDPEDANAWFHLGLSLLALGQLDEAIEASEEAAKSEGWRPLALYNVACCRARKGELEAAFTALSGAADAGYANRGWTEQDGDLAPLRADPRFAALLERIAQNRDAENLGWARAQLAEAGRFLAAGDADQAIRSLVTAMDGDAAEDPLREMLQRALSLRTATVDDCSEKARRWLAAHPWRERAVLAPADEPGERMVVRGVVRDRAGQPIAGAKLRLFHADAQGSYRPERAMDEPHSRLNAWIETGPDGRYEFESVRPGGYPKPRGDVGPDAGDVAWIPQHVHYEVEAAGHAARSFQLVFEDDPRMTPHWRAWAVSGHHPVIALERGAAGVLTGVCDVPLD